MFDNHTDNRAIEASDYLLEMQPTFPIYPCQSLVKIPELVNMDSMDRSLADSVSEQVFQFEFQSPEGSPSSAVNLDDPLNDFASCLGVNVLKPSDAASVPSACHIPLSSTEVVSHYGELKTNAQFEENRFQHTFSQDSTLTDCDDIESQIEIPPRHSGLLWTCGNCYKGNSYKDNMLNHLKKENHQILFPHNIPPTIWGHEKTAKKDK